MCGAMLPIHKRTFSDSGGDVAPENAFSVPTRGPYEYHKGLLRVAEGSGSGTN